MPELQFVSNSSQGKYAELKAIMRWPTNVNKQKIHLRNYYKKYISDQNKTIAEADDIELEEATHLNLILSMRAIDENLLNYIGGLELVMKTNYITEAEDTAVEKMDKTIGIAMLIMYLNKIDKRFGNSKEYSTLNQLAISIANGNLLPDLDFKISARTTMKYWGEKKTVAHLLAADFVCDKILKLDINHEEVDDEINMYINALTTTKFDILIGFANTLQAWGLEKKSSPTAKNPILDEHKIYTIPPGNDMLDIPKTIVNYFYTELC